MKDSKKPIAFMGHGPKQDGDYYSSTEECSYLLSPSYIYGLSICAGSAEFRFRSRKRLALQFRQKILIAGREVSALNSGNLKLST